MHVNLALTPCSGVADQVGFNLLNYIYQKPVSYYYSFIACTVVVTSVGIIVN